MDTTAGLLYGLGYGAGSTDVVVVSSPAAGANAAYKIPGGRAARLLAARASLTTDANVANRFLSVDYLNGRDITYCRNAAGLVVTASTTAQTFEWNAARTVAEWAANTPVFAPLLPAYLMPGDTIQFTLDNKQATDQLSGLVLYLEVSEVGDHGYALGAVPELMLAGRPWRP